MTFHSLPHRAGTTSLPFSIRSDRPTHIPANTGRPHHRQAGPPPGHRKPWLTFRSMHRSPLSPTSRAGTSPARPRRQANPYRGTTHLAYATHPTGRTGQTFQPLPFQSDIPPPAPPHPPRSDRLSSPGAKPGRHDVPRPRLVHPRRRTSPSRFRVKPCDVPHRPVPGPCHPSQTGHPCRAPLLFDEPGRTSTHTRPTRPDRPRSARHGPDPGPIRHNKKGCPQVSNLVPSTASGSGTLDTRPKRKASP